MNKIIKITILFLLIGMSGLSYGQVKFIGLEKKVTPPEIIKYFQPFYEPKCQLIGDTLYVSTNTGIYKKDLTKTDNIDWELFGFEGTPITEFVKKGDSVLAISPGTINGNSQLLLLSEDNGKTFKDYTSSHFLGERGYNYLFRIAQNPQNPNSVLMLPLFYGVSESVDFGKSWNLLNDKGGYENKFIGFHPLDTMSMFYCGVLSTFEAYMLRSYDNGKTWSSYEYPGGDNCMNHIAFHPSDPNIIVSSGQARVGKSLDKGQTWTTVDLYDAKIYFNKFVFDETNPSILYAVGSNLIDKDNEEVKVYRSKDMGDSWEVAYTENLGLTFGGVIDMVEYKNKLIFYTRNAGIYELDLKYIPTSIDDLSHSSGLAVYPNPVRDKLYFQTAEKVRQINIIDINGRILHTKYISDNENSIDVSTLAKGIYFFIFHTDKKIVSRKIYISN